MTGAVSSDCSSYGDCCSGFKTEGAGGEDANTDNSNKNTGFQTITPKQLKNHYIPNQSVLQHIVDDTNELFASWWFLVICVMSNNYCSSPYSGAKLGSN